MTVFTIKAHAKTKTRKVESLIRKARESSAVAADRVLVVYDENAANIYFEGEAPTKPTQDA